jgi:Uncharacterized conserved protein
MLTVNTANLISAGKMRSNCGDIRFTYLNTSDNKEYEIPYWIESRCNTANTIIWIKVPYIPANGNATVYMYYGNPDATSISNGSAVFDWFDDFSTNTISAYRRYSQGSTTTLYWDSSQGTVYAYGDSAGYQHSWVPNNMDYSDNTKIIVRVKASSSSGNNRPGIAFVKTSDLGDFIVWSVRADNGYFELVKFINGAYTVIAGAPGASYNTWYVLQAVKTELYIKFGMELQHPP